MILAIDPGVTCGVAWLEMSGDPVSLTHVHYETLGEYLDTLPRELQPKVVVFEDFIQFRGKSKSLTGSRHETAQAIGVIRDWARRNNIPCIRQSTQERDAGYKWGEIPKQTDHTKSHKWDAYAHGYHYAVKTLGVKTPLEQRNGK